MLDITSIETLVYRVPLDMPVRTSFGEMRDRPAVFVRLTDADGNEGWGEAFCNWPAAGAEHRARLILDDLAELLFSRPWPSPSAMWFALTELTEVKVLQTGEPGPFAQAIAALDIALWDLAARKKNVSLSQLLNPAASERVRTYASGIHIDDAQDMIPLARAQGFSAFKVKIGFDVGADAEKVRQVRNRLDPAEKLMADANQGWRAEEAAAFMASVADLDLIWLEEPIRVDAAQSVWDDLALNAGVPLAGGENFLGEKAFHDAIESRSLGVIQPDVMKWGGVSRCFDVGTKARQAGKMYCPHFLGGGIGLLASAHLLAAVGGDGYLEFDVNPNPLRSDMFVGWPGVTKGEVRLPDGPGLGHAPELEGFAAYLVLDDVRRA